jgi:preprotein translocase SecE subunit
MNFGIYRPGQGYWVRVMTAVAAGVLVLATAGWLFNQMVRVPVPVKHWNIAVEAQTGEINAGDTVRLFVEADDESPFATGTLEASSSIGTGLQLQVADVDVVVENRDPSSTTVVRTLGGFEGFVPTQSSVARVQMFEQIYLQAAVAGVVMLLGSLVVYYFVASRPGSVDFLISTDGEMKKVNWSTKRDIYRSTLVVIFASLIIAGGLFAVDTAFASFFRFVGVLQQ